MSVRKEVEPYWLTREEGNLLAGQPYGIIPRITPGYLTTKIFYLPITMTDYGKRLSYANVFDRINLRDYDYPSAAYGFTESGEPIKREIEKILHPCELREGATEKEIMTYWEDWEKFCINWIRSCMQRPTDFAISNNPLMVKWRDLFFRLIETSWYGSTAQARQKAKERLDTILERPQGPKDRKLTMPSFLYLDGLVEYVHGITEAMRLSYMSGGEDPRVEELSANEQELLVRIPAKLTRYIVAKRLNLDWNALDAMLRAEAKAFRDPENAPRELVFKASVHPVK